MLCNVKALLSQCIASSLAASPHEQVKGSCAEMCPSQELIQIWHFARQFLHPASARSSNGGALGVGVTSGTTAWVRASNVLQQLEHWRSSGH